MTVAVSTHTKGDERTSFIDVVVFRKLAEALSSYLQKGRMVSIDGHLSVRKLESEGHKVAEVVADRIRLLDRAREDDRHAVDAVPVERH